MSVRLSSLAEAVGVLEKLELARWRARGAWSVGQVLVHCAQSIEYSLSGFPKYKPWLFRATVGKLALAKFLSQGAMSHNADAQIPGAPPPDDVSPQLGRERLLRAIAAFAAHQGALAPHFAYGDVDRPRYDRVQAMHIADHLSRFEERPD
jgi:hypothetical protein